MYVCISKYHFCAHGRQERVLYLPKLVTGGCEPPHVFWEWRLGSLKEQLVSPAPPHLLKTITSNFLPLRYKLPSTEWLFQSIPNTNFFYNPFLSNSLYSGGFLIYCRLEKSDKPWKGRGRASLPHWRVPFVYPAQSLGTALVLCSCFSGSSFLIREILTCLLPKLKQVSEGRRC